MLVGMDGRALEDYRAEIFVRCHCGCTLWHAWADLVLARAIQRAAFGELLGPPEDSIEQDGFAPFLLGLVSESRALGRNDFRHADEFSPGAIMRMKGWAVANESERQRCPNPRCRRRQVTISRRRTYQRLRTLWAEANAANEPRIAYVEV